MLRDHNEDEPTPNHRLLASTQTEDRGTIASRSSSSTTTTTTTTVCGAQGNNDNKGTKGNDKLLTRRWFLGFEDESHRLEELWNRWKVLERWIELAVRPASIEECHPMDRFLLSANGDGGGGTGSTGDSDDDSDNVVDDLPALRNQCAIVQGLLNEQLSTLSIETTRWDPHLVVKRSQIPEAGMGLYYLPRNTNEAILPEGSLVCYYTGQVHTHSSSRRLKDKSYLMWIRGNTLVDPAPLPDTVKARYINDPLNEDMVNCRLVPNNNTAVLKDVVGDERPHEDTIRNSVVTIRDVRPGEELFYRYGEAYWNQQPISGNTLVLRGNGKTSSNDGLSTRTDNNSNNDRDHKHDPDEEKISNDDIDDDDDDVDATLPFSLLFQSQLMKPLVWENPTD